MKGILMKTAYKHLFALIVTTVYFFTTLLLFGSCFCINDDRFMGELLSGTVTGKIESHLVYVNYLLSLPLSWFYHLSTSIPWFGIMLLLFHFLSCYVILDSFYCKCKCKKDFLISTLLVGVLFLSELFLITRISYTITASFMAVSGFICLILNENKKQRYRYFILLEFLAFLLRDKAMLMILPLGFSVFFGLVLIQKNETLKTKFIETAKVFFLIIIMFIVGFLGNKIGYHDSDWGTYKEYNDARTTLFDYNWFPPYEEVSDILDKYTVEKTDYVAYMEYTTLDYKISLDCIQELAEYTTEKKAPISFKELISTYKIKTIWDPYYKTNFLMLIGYICVILFLLLSGHVTGLIPISFLMIARTIIWLYLLMAGRFPHRISMPLIACETALIVCTAFHMYLSKKTYFKWQNPLFIALGLAFAFVGIISFKDQFSAIKPMNQVQKTSMKSYYEVLDYCNNNLEKPYILDTLSFTNYNASVFDIKLYGKQNFTMSGTWFSNSPSMLKRVQNYLGESKKDFYFIVLDKEDGFLDELNHPIVLYLEKEAGSTPIIKDTISTTLGVNYSVIYFDNKLTLDTTP